MTSSHEGQSSPASRSEGPTGRDRDPGQSVLKLKPVPSSVPEARRFVLTLEFTARADPDRLALLTAEIVTNAILHARTPLSLEASELAGGVRVSVTDGNSNPPVMKSYGATSPTGRGLHIVESLADRWGFDQWGSGKTVWFELDHGEISA